MCTSANIAEPPKIDVGVLIKLRQDADEIQERTPSCIITDKAAFRALGTCKYPSVQHHASEAGFSTGFSFDGIPIKTYETPEIAKMAAIIAQIDGQKPMLLMGKEENADD